MQHDVIGACFGVVPSSFVILRDSEGVGIAILLLFGVMEAASCPIFKQWTAQNAAHRLVLGQNAMKKTSIPNSSFRVTLDAT